MPGRGRWRRCLVAPPLSYSDIPEQPGGACTMDKSRDQGFSEAGAREGKLGLALSGGGFRAALFHVGVLAQLADRDLLRHVAVISTVSGGSIIGAFYYLKVKQLLEGRRRDGLEATAAGFRQLVLEVEREFLAGVQHNLRLSVFTDGRKNARMLGADQYSSTQRLAELFDAFFFTPISGQGEVMLGQLPIEPVRSLDCAVPELILNATALNTGHLFQFTGRHVGEAQVDSVFGGVSSMGRLPRLSLGDPALAARQRVRLDRITVGDAVVASCCVPGLLDPFSLGGLYRDDCGEEVVVRLVDGGVFDNQGVVSLFEERCTHFVCSDATDLLTWESRPSERVHNVLVRTNEIMMDRIRGEVLDELLKRGPDKSAVFTLGEVAGEGLFSEESAALVRTLGGIRTDLDAFSEVEAAALMYYGFRLSGSVLPPVAAAEGQEPPTEPAPAVTPERGGVPVAAPTGDGAWPFTAIGAQIADPEQRSMLLRQLQVGSRQFLKVFYLGKPLPYVVVIAPLMIPVALFALLIYLLPPIPTPAWVVLGAIVLVGVAFSQNARILELLDQVEAFRRFRVRLAVALRPLGVTVIMGAVAAAACRLYLNVFNRMFLRYGRLQGSRQQRLGRRQG